MTRIRDLIHELRIELAQHRLLHAKPSEQKRRWREFMALIRK